MCSTAKFEESYNALVFPNNSMYHSVPLLKTSVSGRRVQQQMVLNTKQRILWSGLHAAGGESLSTKNEEVTLAVQGIREIRIRNRHQQSLLDL